MLAILLFLVTFSAKIGGFALEGNRIFPDSLLEERVFKKYIGDTLTSSVLRKSIEELLQFYLNNGFPFARVEPLYMEESGEEIVVHLRIDEGRPAVPSRVAIEGLVRTNRDFIKKFFPLEGKLFSPSLIKRSLSQLGFLPFLKFEGYHFEADDGLTLVLSFRERKANSIKGALGYDRRGGILVGEVDVKLLNLFGTGKRLKFHWKRLNLRSQRFYLHAFYPYISGAPLGVGVKYEFDKQDTLYYTTQYGGEVSFIRGALRVSVGFNKEYMRDFEEDVEEENIMSTGGFEYDTRTPSVSPVRGVRVWGSGKYSYAKKKFEGGFDLYRGITKLLIAHLEGWGFLLRKNGRVLWAEYTKVGGQSTLRGYREGSFWLLNGAVLRTELLLGQGPFVYPFFDCLNDEVSFHYGYGFGIRGETGWGTMELDIAFSPSRDIYSPLIYFSLGGKF